MTYWQVADGFPAASLHAPVGLPLPSAHGTHFSAAVAQLPCGSDAPAGPASITHAGAQAPWMGGGGGFPASVMVQHGNLEPGDSMGFAGTHTSSVLQVAAPS